MALSVEYVVKETATNLRRNALMTLASILTVFLSLLLAGGALLLKQGVARATVQWRGGVELSIFMQTEASPSQSDAIERELSKMPEVKKVTYVDQEGAYREFKQMFSNSPDMLESVQPKDLPPSYRVVPRKAELVETIGERFKKREGVRDVVYAKDAVKTLLNVTNILKWVVYLIAGILLFSASLLILNTIRMAIFARRREVAVMKLVGATNWFIRIPFMLEGMIQGLVGGTIAFIVLFAVRARIQDFVNSHKLALIHDLIVSSNEVIGTGILILVVGGLVGAVGSAIAVRRFLDV
jgi:cell division transport system permease protein